jgi:hypothetical protein
MLEILLILACFIPIFTLIFLCYAIAMGYDELKRRSWQVTLRELLIAIAICSLILAGLLLLKWFVAELPPKDGFLAQNNVVRNVGWVCCAAETHQRSPRRRLAMGSRCAANPSYNLAAINAVDSRRQISVGGQL